MCGSPLFREDFCWHISGYPWDFHEPRHLPAATHLDVCGSSCSVRVSAVTCPDICGPSGASTPASGNASGSPSIYEGFYNIQKLGHVCGSPLLRQGFCWHIPGYPWHLHEPQHLPAAMHLAALRFVRVVTTSRSVDTCAAVLCSVRVFAGNSQQQRVWQPCDL